ncbi:MAG: ABC transporter permease [Coprococcus sp.]
MKSRRFIIILFVAFIVFLMLAPTQSVTKVDMTNTFAGPSPEHWLGTDNLGRDVFSMVANGCRRTLEVVVIATVVGLLSGTVLGLLAGYYGGLLETIIQFLSDLLLIIPSFIVALVFMGIFGFSPFNAGVVLGIGGIGGYCQQMMILSKQLKYDEFILSERIIGISDLRIIFRHILPNVKNALLTFMANHASSAVVSYAGLAYIGLGTDVTTPDWGSMIYQNRLYIVNYPGLVLWPTLGIFMLALFFHLMFDNRNAGKKVSIYE